MKVTYLGHSGFLAETEKAYYVIDYIRGDLPEFSEKKSLYVLVSHEHRDHWNPGVFTDPKLQHAKLFLLGFDIKEPFEEMVCEEPDLLRIPVAWAYPEKTVGTEDFSCDPLLSTDEGVAFLIREENMVLYHAGDLNWWHWNGDPEERNRERAQNFKKEIDRLQGIPIEAAFVPLDPRQEEAYRFCMDYCMETLDAKYVFPMHFWKKYELCRQYRESLKEQHPDWYGRFQEIRSEGQTFLLE